MLIVKSLLHAQQTLYKIQVGRGYRTLESHGSFAFGGFLGEDVAFERFLKSNLSGAGYLEPFLGTGICFNLGHFSPVYDFTLPAFRTGGHLGSRLGNDAVLSRGTARPFFSGCKDRVNV